MKYHKMQQSKFSLPVTATDTTSDFFSLYYSLFFILYHCIKCLSLLLELLPFLWALTMPISLLTTLCRISLGNLIQFSSFTYGTIPRLFFSWKSVLVHLIYSFVTGLLIQVLLIYLVLKNRFVAKYLFPA